MKRAALFFIIISIVLYSGCFSPPKKREVDPVTASDFRLDTIIEAALYEGGDENVLKEAFAEIEDLENILSAEIPGSDPDRLMKSAGGDFIQVSPETFFLLKESVSFSEISDGAFDCTVGPLAALWNIKERSGYVPSQEEISAARSLVGYKGLLFKNDNRVMLEREGMKINFGAIAKGYIGDRTREFLVKSGVSSAVINLGGNVVIIGERTNGKPFRIGLQDPEQKTGSYMAIIEAYDTNIVTSGSYQRYFVYNDKKYHHILDPTTGFPAENELAGVTIICRNGAAADALSTTAFLLGLEDGLDLINEYKGAEGIFITKDKKVYVTSGIGNTLNITSTEYSLASYTSTP